MPTRKASRRILRAAAAAGLVASLAVAGLSSSTAAPSQAELDRARERLQELEKDSRSWSRNTTSSTLAT